jgi:hypothetical protein
MSRFIYFNDEPLDAEQAVSRISRVEAERDNYKKLFETSCESLKVEIVALRSQNAGLKDRLNQKNDEIAELDTIVLASARYWKEMHSDEIGCLNAAELRWLEVVEAYVKKHCN